MHIESVPPVHRNPTCTPKRTIFPYPRGEPAKMFGSQDTVPESTLRRSSRIATRAEAAARGTGKSDARDGRAQQCAAVTNRLKKHKMDSGVSSAAPATETEVILIEDDEDEDNTLHEVSAPEELPNSQEPSPTASVEGNTSLLLTLPGELRNRIYRFALCQNHSIWITRLTWPTHQPALLKTNRQIRTEATRLFYHENVFSKYSTPTPRQTNVNA